MDPRELDRLRARRLPARFYAVDGELLARALLGTCIVHVIGPGDVRVARVVETEAYRGPDDRACHARFGLTARTRALLGPPGHAYVFLVYGMHECFNVVGLRDGAGHAALVRAVEPVTGIAEDARTDGPGRLTRALGLDRGHDGASLLGDALFLTRGRAPSRIATSARVGVAYAGEMAEEPWRFFDEDSACVSRPPRSSIGLGAGGLKAIGRRRPAPSRSR